jgi:hypothetical protein
MKADKFIKASGPYEVCSISQDGHGVRLEVYPAFPEYNSKQQKGIDTIWLNDPRWPIHRYKGEGGGPGIFTCMALARAFEDFLNQCYTPEQVEQWKATNAEALKDVRAKEQKRFEKHMAKLETTRP